MNMVRKKRNGKGHDKGKRKGRGQVKGRKGMNMNRKRKGKA